MTKINHYNLLNTDSEKFKAMLQANRLAERERLKPEHMLNARCLHHATMAKDLQKLGCIKSQMPEPIDRFNIQLWQKNTRKGRKRKKLGKREREASRLDRALNVLVMEKVTRSAISRKCLPRTKDDILAKHERKSKRHSLKLFCDNTSLQDAGVINLTIDCYNTQQLQYFDKMRIEEKHEALTAAKRLKDIDFIEIAAEKHGLQ